MAAPVTRDQELELTIDSLAFGGNGVARLNGFVVFVRRGLPGDTVRARVTKVQRRHAEALATEILSAGPLRVEAPCQHYPADWNERARALLDDFRRLRRQHILCGKPERKGFWRRLYEGLQTSQQRRADREIAAFIARHGGLLSDDMERQIMQRIAGERRRSV